MSHTAASAVSMASPVLQEGNENAAPPNGECGETPKPLDQACLEGTPTPVRNQYKAQLQLSQTSKSKLFEIFEECMTQTAGAAALESEPPQIPMSQFFEIFEDHLTPAAAFAATAVEPALAEPVRVLCDLPQWEGEFRHKNTFIDDFFVDPPASTSLLSGNSEPRDFLRPRAPVCQSPTATPRPEKPEPVTPNELPQHTTQVTIKKTFLHFADPPASASQLSVNSEPRSFAPQAVTCDEEEEEEQCCKKLTFAFEPEPRTPETTFVINLHQALGAPSTSTPQRLYPGAIQLNLAIWIPPFPIASSSSSPSQPVRLLAEHFPDSSMH